MRQKVEGWLLGLGLRGGKRELVFRGDRVSVLQDGRVLCVDGDRCATVNTLNAAGWALMINRVKFISCVLYPKHMIKTAHGTLLHEAEQRSKLMVFADETACQTEK